jgi:helix-turn-helix protein
LSWQATDYVTKHSTQRGSARALLLTIATHAHADGTDAHMSVATLARETSLKDRQVQRLLRLLEASGELARVGRTRVGTNRYMVVGVPGQQLPLLADNVVPIRAKGVTSVARGGDIHDTPGVTSRAEGGVMYDTRTVPGTVSEPSTPLPPRGGRASA